MKAWVLVFSLLTATHGSIKANEVYAVASESGISLREAPNTQAGRLAILLAGTEVLLIEQTEKTIEISDPTTGELVKGKWLKVETPSKLVGYVADLFLLKKSIPEFSQCVSSDKRFPCPSIIDSQLFTATIYSYQTQNNNWNTGDTIHTFEWVFNGLGDRVLHIGQSADVTRVQVFYSVTERLEQQFNFREEETPDDWKEWRKNRVYWHGQSDYVSLARNRNFFLIPNIRNDEQERLRKERMNLRDTMVDLSGESWNVATAVYKGKACTYVLFSGLLKIVLTLKDGTTETRYIESIFSYGC